MGTKAINLYPDICDFQQLRRAAGRAKKGVRKNTDLCHFWNELDVQLLRLQASLVNQSYRPSPYTSFMCLDPKPRKIQAAAFVDRVVHHSLCESLAPHLERSYLAHSFACQKGKGNHRAVKQAQKYARRFRNGHVLKIDIWHCFERIDHSVLMAALQKRVACPKTLWLSQLIIEHGGHDHRGLPIGNLTSQHFANFYLDRLDHYCVEKLHIKGFVRYMDDLLLFSHSKDQLLEALGELSLFLPQQLNIELKHSATRLSPTFQGFSFLGFRIFPNDIRFDAARKRRFIQKWKAIERLPEATQAKHFQSLIAWAQQANTCQLRRSLLPEHRLQP